MKGTQLERIVGLFVVGSLACMGYFALRLGSVSLRPVEYYSVEARFTNASGLIAGSEVSVAGVQVGSVASMKLGEDFSAWVQLKLRKDYKLPTDTIASIRGHGLLGDKYVALSPGSADDFLTSGSKLTDTESAVDLESLLSRFAFGSMQGDKAEKKGDAKEEPKP